VATKQHLSIIQGDSKTYNLTFRDTAGIALDISTWTVLFTVKRNYSDADVDAIITKTIVPGQHTDPTNGKTAIPLTHAETELFPTGTFYYSIQTIPSVGLLYTLLKGNYLVEEVADRN